jgi:hypothetical protein
MEALPFEPDEYETSFLQGHTRAVRGLIVGRLAVRRALPTGESVQGPRTRGHRIDGQWLVEIMGTTWTINSYARVETALIVADELSRFAVGDIETVKSISDIAAAFGVELCAWLETIDPSADVVTGFREWKAELEQ